MGRIARLVMVGGGGGGGGGGAKASKQGRDQVERGAEGGEPDSIGSPGGKGACGKKRPDCRGKTRQCEVTGVEHMAKCV